ncbi:UDP-N-acetylmuramate dehydrogenase [Paenibacillus sp. 481]|uniref:UDP-N-acetylmuramate dehydrogenase n=1 Tax=Paenibacillus sp. 481 TaxID=2835869 RepID=UPI001E35DFD1|nr:UDP-N-acetylmuramate dehydrogenase [Paenibacillus sp. 481]UHA73583.1 UDP-N-acetylmuramate dehydrogenase [Paenibacillus sp. 481]
MNTNEIYQYLLTILPQDDLKQDEPLKNYTYIKVGGKADIFVTPSTYEDVQRVVRYAHEHQVPLTCVGYGSNVIIRDGGIRGITMSLVKLNSIHVSEHERTITAQSGAAIIDASRTALAHSLTGLEFACGIPGTVGGALYMNAGAYGGEISFVLAKAIAVTLQGEMYHLSREDFAFGYRQSSFASNHAIILEATFELEEGVYAAIKEKMDELTYLRESKQPLEYPSCGSVFKRPPQHFAGKLIQDSGLQGTKIGGVEVSTKHAGFMVNVSNGTAQDYIELITFVQTTVQQKFGVMLETEVKIIGEDNVAE